MPKRVDARERRQEIARALWRVIATQGMDEVSLRHVAAEAGVSPGRVQHWFGTKDQMLRFALDTVSEQIAARITARLTEEHGASPRRQVRTLLAELLPLDETRRLESHIALAFGARAAVSPEIAHSLREGRVQLLAFLAERIRAEHPDHAAERAQRAAMALTALVDGLAAHTMTEQGTPDDALATLDDHLDLIFGPDAPA